MDGKECISKTRITEIKCLRDKPLKCGSLKTFIDLVAALAGPDYYFSVSCSKFMINIFFGL